MPAKSISAGALPKNLGVLAVLAGLAVAPAEAQGQLRSQVTSVTLTAYAAPGVRIAQSAIVGRRPVSGGSSDLAGMSVNTAYRLELHCVGRVPVVLLRQDRAGLVPWEQVRALLGASDTDSMVLDLVLTPTL